MKNCKILIAGLILFVLGFQASAMRVATYNASLYRSARGALAAELVAGSEQAVNIARVINEINPDIILLNEFDYDESGSAARLFVRGYLGWPDAHWFNAPSNTGVDSGVDLNSNGKQGEPADCLGFGRFPGQYGMLLVSKYPIDEANVRTFRKMLWRDMPHAIYPETLPEEALGVFRLSSKSHWDVPVKAGGRVIHILASHPTPPVFDGPEDLNGRRNHDEIRFWLDYITPSRSGYITDDVGSAGGLAESAFFVVLGDMNCDPLDGDGRSGAIGSLLHSALVSSSNIPSSAGGMYDSLIIQGVNKHHKGSSAFDTGSFAGPGNLRLDYVLPSIGMKISGAGVFWPLPEDELYETVREASDHRVVYVDID